MELYISEEPDWATLIAEYGVEALHGRNVGETLAEMYQRRIFPAWYPVRSHILGRIRAFDRGTTPPVPEGMPEALVKLGMECMGASWAYMRIQSGDWEDAPLPIRRRMMRVLNEGPLT